MEETFRDFAFFSFFFGGGVRGLGVDCRSCINDSFMSEKTTSTKKRKRHVIHKKNQNLQNPNRKKKRLLHFSLAFAAVSGAGNQQEPVVFYGWLLAPVPVCSRSHLIDPPDVVRLHDHCPQVYNPPFSMPPTERWTAGYRL